MASFFNFEKNGTAAVVVAGPSKVLREKTAFCIAPTMASQFKCIQEPDPDLICQICHNVAINPRQESNCGKLFCISCIDKLANPSSIFLYQPNQRLCPNCKKEPKYFPDKRGKREIDNLKVNCKYEEDGCPWIGRLGDAPDHVAKSCEFTEVHCKYEDIGCKEKLIRKRQREHEEDDTIHIPLLVNAGKKMREEQNSICGTGQIIIVHNYSRIKRLNQIVKSEPFHNNDYKMCLVVTPNGIAKAANHVGVAIELLEQPQQNEFPHFHGAFTVTLLNQKYNKDHYSKTKSPGLTFMIGNKVVAPCNKEKVVEWDQYISHSEIESSNYTVQYVNSDTIYFKVTFESTQPQSWLNVSTLASTAQDPL